MINGCFGVKLYNSRDWMSVDEHQQLSCKLSVTETLGHGWRKGGDRAVPNTNHHHHL